MNGKEATWLIGGLIVGGLIGYWIERRRCQAGKTP